MNYYSDLIIDSRERNSSNSISSSNFNINLYSSISNIEKVRLNWVQIPNTFYNINTNNNIVSFTENSTLKTATIPVGSYNADELASELQSILTTASGEYNTYTVSYNPQTFMFTFSANNAFQFNCSKSLFPYHELGFSNIDTNSATNITSSYVISLEQPTEIIISINQFDKRIITSTSQFGETFNIVNKAFIGELLFYEPDGGIIKDLFNVQTFNSLEIKLLDRYGNVLDLNEADWSMSLTCFNKV